MNDTQALFSRLTALAAYFEAGHVRWQAEEVFSPRAILAQGRVAPTERIRAAEDAEGGNTPHETILTLLQRTAAVRPDLAPVRQTERAPLLPVGARESGFSLSKAPGFAPEPDAEALSRAFCRDARRYDE